MLRVIFINSNPERNFLVKRLFPQNWKVRYTAGVSDSIGWLRKEDFDCVLCDFYREEKSNTFFFEILNNTNIPVFIWPTRKISQNEFKILKTELRNCYFFNNSDTFETVKTEIISHTFENEKKHCFFDNLISISPAMEELKKRIVKYAENDFPVLIYGESGTGKELVARAVHNLSSRGDNIFTAVNMSSIPEQLAESEFFGVIKGAYTDACQRKGLFCSSTGGSIFLDEIETTPIYLQAKLLRAIETKQVTPLGQDTPVNFDTRIICASNINLRELISKKAFRSDFYYRICVLTLEIPPLRERKEDIVPILEYFTKDVETYISKNALDKILNYHWPGNVRELKNCIERAVAISNNNVIHPEDIIFV